MPLTDPATARSTSVMEHTHSHGHYASESKGSGTPGRIWTHSHPHPHLSRDGELPNGHSLSHNSRDFHDASHLHDSEAD